MVDVSGFFMLLLLAVSFYEVITESRTNFKIKRFEVCLNNTIIKFAGNITDENDLQYLTCDIRTPVPIDEHIGATCFIESKVNNNIFMPLFTIREKNFCLAANKYMGEFWYGLLRAAQLSPGACPIRAGHYEVHHGYLDYKAISLQTFPFGRIRFTYNFFDNGKPREILLCFLIEVENMPN